jgi:NADH:ubiquinone oxidoreductase subunit K
VTLEVWVLFSLALFCLGLYAVLARRNLIAILIGVELMLNAASVNFLAFNHYMPPADTVAQTVVGQIVILFIIGLAAAEAAIALSIVLAVYRNRSAIDADSLDELKG